MPIDLSNCVLNARKVICELEDLEKKWQIQIIAGAIATIIR